MKRLQQRGRGPKTRLDGELELLTPRERQVLVCLAQALAYKQIAARLGMSLNTARTHLSSIYRKLNAHSRTEVVVKYLRSQSSNRPHPKM
jgi:DNA-binding NarL/FixJ family response regulator